MSEGIIVHKITKMVIRRTTVPPKAWQEGADDSAKSDCLRELHKAQATIEDPEINLEVPRVRLTVSGLKPGNKSGNTPETLSEQILNFQFPYSWRSPNLGK